MNFKIMQQPSLRTKKRNFSIAKSFTLGLISLFMLSCEKDNDNIPSDTSQELAPIAITYDQKTALKKDFALALAKAVNENSALRTFIKAEALKMFDKDYDILYHMVKDQKLADGSTFRQAILNHYKSENRLSQIEQDSPLLTIFVPALANESFSAHSWNTATEIPSVAIRMNNTNDVPVFDSTGKELVLPGYAIPAFPVIVIKENERVILKDKNTLSNANGAKLMQSDTYAFEFLDTAFDGISKTDDKSSRKSVNALDTKIINAYNIYKNADGWHRDYLYYNLTPQNTKDQFSFDFQEHITKFSMNGDAMSAYEKISDQSGDPVFRSTTKKNDRNPWTGGAFEFKISVLINSKNGIGSELNTYFSATPDELFDIEYASLKFWGTRFYIINSISNKEIDLNLPIFNWDLNEYASSIKLSVEEVDLTVQTVVTEQRSVQFATNFGIDSEKESTVGGVLKKIGLKFGASRETNQLQTVQKSFTQGNDELGSVIINFADDVITGQNSGNYSLRDYSTGFYKIQVAPVRVQGL